MFRNNKFIDKTKEEQIADVKQWYQGKEDFVDNILKGMDCDKLPDGIGEFGRSQTNPIPVNGSGGQLMYLHRLRCRCGCGLFFHRLGSVRVSKTGAVVDIYETVCIRGKHWDILYLDLYHPRRSSIVPNGYKPSRFDKVMCMTPITFGTDTFITKFPEDLPRVLSIVYADFPGEPLARKAQELLNENNYKRTNDQVDKLKNIRVDNIASPA
jgi:hypothetical protein